MSRKSGSDHGGDCYVGDDRRMLPENAAISLALSIELRKDPSGPTGATYVRRAGVQGPIARVERIGAAVVATRIR